MALLSTGAMIAQGLAEGLKQGLLTYNDVKKQQRDEDKQLRDDNFRRTNMGLLAREHGLVLNPDSTGPDDQFMPTETQRAKEAQALADAQRGVQSSDATSDYSKARRGLYGGLLKASGGNVAIPDNMSADELAKDPILGAAVTGGYGLQRAQAAAAGRGQGREESYGFRDKQLAQRTHNQLMARLDRDPTLKAQFGQLRGMDNAAQLVTRAVEEGKPITRQQFEDFQQSVIANLGQKGVQAVGERNSKYFDSLGIRGDAALQLLTGVPQDIGKDHPLYQHVHDLARWETENVRSQIQDQIDGVTAGLGYIYDENPSLKNALDQKIKALMKKTNTRNFGGAESPKGLIQPDAPAGKTTPAALPPEERARIEGKLREMGVIK
jgi:hypothetical protein